MPSRKFHTKSRHGCAACKKSKVKCDLDHPVCGRCLRLARGCSFLDAQGAPATLSVSPRPPAPAPAPAPTPAPLGAPGSGEEGNVRGGTRRDEALKDVGREEAVGLASSVPSNLDLRLMHHYSTRTCLTMHDDAKCLPAWRDDIPLIALEPENGFLLHGILGISAMHLRQVEAASLSPTQSAALLATAEQHQSAALKTYIPSLSHVTEENVNALFAFSATLGGLSYAFLPTRSSIGPSNVTSPSSTVTTPRDLAGSESFVDGVVSVFDLLTGSSTIATQGAGWLREGPLSSMMGDPFANKNPQLADRVERALKGILHANTPASSPSAGTQTQAVYARALMFLKYLFDTLRPAAPAAPAVVGWPIFPGTEFNQLLKQKDPKALLILGCYGAAMERRRDIWYLNGVGTRLVGAVMEVLASMQVQTTDLQEVFDWAKEDADLWL